MLNHVECHVPTRENFRASHRTMKKLLLILTLVAVEAFADAQGTIQFANNAGTRFSFDPRQLCDFPPCQQRPLYFGVFVGLTAESISSQPLGPLGTNTMTAGLITSASSQAHPIPDFDPGSNVFIQIRGWEVRFGDDWRRGQAESWFGQTGIKPFVLGPAGGPGTVIWSSTDPTKFQAILFTIPEPSKIPLISLGLGGLILFRRRK